MPSYINFYKVGYVLKKIKNLRESTFLVFQYWKLIQTNERTPGSGAYLSQETLYRSESYKKKLRRTAPFEVGSKSHCRAAPAVPSPIWCPSNLIFTNSSKLTYEVKNCNDIMFLC